MKRYGYHRTSTKEQHLDRGITEIQNYCITNNLELEKIFTDQQTGKNFNRPRYQVLKEDVLRSGDVQFALEKFEELTWRLVSSITIRSMSAFRICLSI